MKKKVLGLLLSMAILVGLFPETITTYAATSGKCGDNLTWILDNTGILTISGTGKMSNYSSFAAPWNDYRKEIKAVDIHDGVTSIGSSAFENYDYLKSVTIPDSVTYIGGLAFSYCDSLTKIETTSETIGSEAFRSSALEEVVLKNGVKYIESGAFEGCGLLSNVSISDGVIKIGNGAFSQCNSLRSITLPNSIEELGSEYSNYVFRNCANLSDLYYNGTKSEYYKIRNGKEEDWGLGSVPKKHFFHYVNILDINGENIINDTIDSETKLDISKIQEKEGYTKRLYTDVTCTKEFDYENTPITKNTTLYFKYAINQYPNKFVNDDGSVIQESTVDYGAVISVPDIIPAKPADDQYTYTFAGWEGFSEGMTQQAEEMVFTAKYIASVNQYSYHFIDEDGTILKEGTINYGAEIIPPENPTKDSTPQYSYTFAGWVGYTEGMTQSAEDLYFYATYTVSANKYTYRFVDEDGTVLKEKTVNYNTLITAPASHQKAATAQYTYTFKEWKGFTPGMKITGDVTFVAVYTETVNQYTYKFVDESGNVIDEKTVDYGTEIAAPNIVLTKDATDKYTYTHTGWNNYINGMKISENIIFTPIFSSVINQYSYKFVDDDGTILKEDTIDYDAEIIAPENPIKEATKEYTYTFVKWDKFTKGMKQKAETMIFKAIYRSAINRYTYKFMDENGNELKSETVDYGTKIVPPENPSKMSTAKYSYTFKGWNGCEEDMIVTGNVTFVAEYIAEINKYTYKFIDYDGTIVKEATVAYGTAIPLPTAPSEHSDQQYTYMFSSWSGYIKGMIITKDITFTARYSKIINQYTYLFVDEKGETVFEGYADYGTVIEAPDAPIKASTDKYTYVFAGWKNYIDGMVLTDDIVFVPIYTAVINQYTYKFIDEDGTILEEKTVDYDTIIPIPNDPLKEATKKYTYIFAGWEGYADGIRQKAEIMIFKAKYNAILNRYTYKFLNDDGTVIYERTVDYGSEIDLPKNPVKDANKQYSYVFSSWSGYTDEMTITDNVIFTATYTQITNQYTYRFVDENGVVIIEKTVDYGTEVMLPDSPADKDPYTFDYWNGYTNGIIIEENITFTAMYKYKKYIITVDESEKINEVTYGDNYSLPVQKIKDFSFKGYYTKPNGEGTRLTDEQGNSIDAYLFARDITAYPYYIHDLANKAIIIGDDEVCPGDKNVIQAVKFATDKQAKNIKCTLKYPKDIELADLAEKDFVLANIDKTETMGEYTYSYLTCMYDYSGTTIPLNQTITPFELKFNIGEKISPGKITIEMYDVILVGDSNYNIDASAIKNITVLPKLTEKIEIVGPNKIETSTKYTAVVTPYYTTNKEVFWSVDDETVAIIFEDGTLTPIKNGTVVITAAAKDGSEVFATYQVETVAYSKIDSIMINGIWDKDFSSDIREYTVYVKNDINSITLAAGYLNGTVFIDNVLLLSNMEQKIELKNKTTVITFTRNNVKDMNDSEYKITIVKYGGTKTTVSEDGKSLAVKPINIEPGSTVVLALYDGDKLVETSSAPYTGKEISFITDKAYTNAKVMVWDNLEQMIPLCDTEIVK